MKLLSMLVPDAWQVDDAMFALVKEQLVLHKDHAEQLVFHKDHKQLQLHEDRE